MSHSPIARRYAKALIDLCNEAKNHAVIGKQLDSFAETWAGSAELQAIVASPVVALDTKRNILTKIFAQHLFAPLTRNFLMVLLDAGRIDDLPQVAEAFNGLMDQMDAKVRASVTSAVPMERTDLARIQAALQRLTHKTVILDAKVDPDLVGGVVTRIGNVVLDGSVRTQLHSLREQLLA